jgi:hypothetical protein
VLKTWKLESDNHIFGGMKTLATINAHNPKRAQQDKRYRREHSSKTFSSTKGQKMNRYERIKDALELDRADSIDRSNEQKQSRRAKRK